MYNYLDKQIYLILKIFDYHILCNKPSQLMLNYLNNKTYNFTYYISFNLSIKNFNYLSRYLKNNKINLFIRLVTIHKIKYTWI